MRFQAVIMLLVLGAVNWLAVAFWVFGLGHADDRLTPAFMVDTGTAVLGPLLAAFIIAATDRS